MKPKYQIRFNNVTGCKSVCKICKKGQKGCNPRPTYESNYSKTWSF